MNPLFQAALELQQTMKAKNWPFCFIGGLAVIRWGEVRMTQDIDICLMCGFGNEENYIENLIKHYKSRVDDPVTFALNNRVLLLYASNGVAVDISLSGLPFEDEMIRQATYFKFSPDCSVITCSAEDLIILKAFADRPKDWNDIETVAMRQNSKLNVEYITEQLTPLCDLKESPEIIEKLKNVLQK
ncbi:MAG: nucleotidyl transferase AbiEii/AbiGii toxin family protein [Desulfococcaceae bacterium]